MKRRKQRTGADLQTLFLGLEHELRAYLHLRSPREHPEYRKMPTSKICRRIQDDIGELLCRAHPSAGQDWAREFYGPEHVQQFLELNSQSRWQDVDKEHADELCPGLWERLNARLPGTDKPDLDKIRGARKELSELWEQRKRREAFPAADALAWVTHEAAMFLENLSVKCPQLLRDVAKRYQTWPVNIGTRKKVLNGKRRTVLARLAFAEKYLMGLGVNTESTWPERRFSGAEQKSPFRIAADRLYTQLIMCRNEPRVWFPKLGPWAKKLLALSEPMTTANVTDWWNVAKVAVDEHWELHLRNFSPLIKHLGLGGRNITPSLVKKQVIDDSLKKAFRALAVPAE
jgi:hypothetical protein